MARQMKTCLRPEPSSRRTAPPPAGAQGPWARRRRSASGVDCGAWDVSWASVSFGTYFCLECSGQHRSLGTHISFVRSVTMDNWKPAQRTKMRLGGNAKFRAFLKKYGLEDAPISEKYP